MTNFEEINKQLDESLFYEVCNILGKKWVLLIIITINDNIHSFTGIMRTIPKINTGILTQRLKELVDKGYILKTQKNEYELSDKGEALIKGLNAIKKRSDENWNSHIK